MRAWSGRKMGLVGGILGSRNHTIEIEAKDIIKKAKEDKERKLVLEMEKEGLRIPQIARVTKKREEEIKKILDEYRK